MATHLTVGLAQIDCRLGALEANLERHLEWIDRAREHRVDLLLFPELSLTGYRLLHLTNRVALRPFDSELIAKLAAAADDMSVVVGIVEESQAGVLHNSAVLLSAGEVAHVHRKLYLPTYGIFQEGRFLGAGKTLELANVRSDPLGLLICEDLWHPHLARRLALTGCKMLAVTSAGPGRVGSGEKLQSQEAWETLTRSTALLNTIWVFYCNRVGWEEGSFYGGGSHIVSPNGRIVATSPILQEDLLVCKIDLREAERVRWRLPLLQSRRDDIEGPE